MVTNQLQHIYDSGTLFRVTGMSLGDRIAFIQLFVTWKPKSTGIYDKDLSYYRVAVKLYQSLGVTECFKSQLRIEES